MPIDPPDYLDSKDLFLPEVVALLNDDMRQILKALGPQNTAIILGLFGGSSIYIPDSKRLWLHIRDARIRQEFNGANIKMLARKWKLCTRHVRTIVSPKAAK